MVQMNNQLIKAKKVFASDNVINDYEVKINKDLPTEKEVLFIFSIRVKMPGISDYSSEGLFRCLDTSLMSILDEIAMRFHKEEGLCLKNLFNAPYLSVRTHYRLSTKNDYTFITYRFQTNIFYVSNQITSTEIFVKEASKVAVEAIKSDFQRLFNVEVACLDSKVKKASKPNRANISVGLKEEGYIFDENLLSQIREVNPDLSQKVLGTFKFLVESTAEAETNQKNKEITWQTACNCVSQFSKKENQQIRQILDNQKNGNCDGRVGLARENIDIILDQYNLGNTVNMSKSKILDSQIVTKEIQTDEKRLDSPTPELFVELSRVFTNQQIQQILDNADEVKYLLSEISGQVQGRVEQVMQAEKEADLPAPSFILTEEKIYDFKTVIGRLLTEESRKKLLGIIPLKHRSKDFVINKILNEARFSINKRDKTKTVKNAKGVEKTYSYPTKTLYISDYQDIDIPNDFKAKLEGGKIWY